MEKNEDIKGFHEYKTTMRALADGVKLLRRHAGMLLMVMCPLMVIVSALWAWLVLEGMPLISLLMLDAVPEAGEIWAAVRPLYVPIVLLLVSSLFLLAQFYTQFRGYVDNGFIPQTSLVTCWKPLTDTLIKKTFIVWLWVFFVIVCYIAIMGVLVSVSPYTLVLTLSFAIWMACWCGNLLTEFHANNVSLIHAMTSSVRTTAHGILSFMAAAALLVILLVAFGTLACLPTGISMIIYEQAQMSVAMENGQDLPGFFIPLFFISSMVSCYLMLVIKGFYLSCWSMLYGAVSVRISHRNSTKDQTSVPED